ncbi:unnamed protein product [Heligmosomoides polygyrus]|uniref:3Beta_HSD domain-containing protein n=1 Tax=Heligmosomoides polygyrus TaxID=6339 RepID=A0A183F684_HELPZ|nr:unnamed protein product [Heligmosomoides polygyrus]
MFIRQNTFIIIRALILSRAFSVISGCDYVLHIASPFPIAASASCVDVAVTGTLNVLRAASTEPSVKKVVLTSSCAAVNEGHPQDRAFDETSWTDVTSPSVDYYAKSKTLAEKAAWEFVDGIKNGNKYVFAVLKETQCYWTCRSC